MEERRSRRGVLGLTVLGLVAWLAVGAFTGPFAGRLAEVQKNDQESFLPTGAESRRVAELSRKFAPDAAYPAYLVAEGSAPLTTAQVDAVTRFANGIPALEIPVEGGDPVKVGDFLVDGPVTVVPSQDRKAVLALVNFDAGQLTATLPDGEAPIQKAVEQIREQEAALEDSTGVAVYVAGPGGQLADLVTAFGGIDGVLLVVALLTVLVILLVVYRSPVVPFLVILASVFALGLASAVVYLLADRDVITLDGQGQGILSILVVGAATDYSLLLVSRYREELRSTDDRFAAMRIAWRRTVEPIAASGGTVILGLLCLLLADLGPTKGLGPVGAIGVAAAVLSAMTFLPLMLLVPGRTTVGEHGRWIFWPRRPHVGSEGLAEHGLWARVARLVGAHPRRVWIGTGIGLLALAAFLPTLEAGGAKQSDVFLDKVESVTGDEAVARHFPAGSGSPTIVVAPEGVAADATAAVRATTGVAEVVPTSDAQPGTPVGVPKVVDGLVQLQVTLEPAADSVEAQDVVRDMRERLDVVSDDALVGGTSATLLDVYDIANRDRNVVIPAVLLVILVVLGLLLRSVVAPVVLLVANVLSFAATLGAAAIVFEHVFDFPPTDPSIPLYGFVFLVALGIDYSIFLMTRVREESFARGTRAGILAGLAVTGGVITSAGVVLAATFAALGVLPILFLAQIAFIVSFGVLLDTLVVRSLLVPALSLEIGRAIWWPGKLARRDEPVSEPDDLVGRAGAGPAG